MGIIGCIGLVLITFVVVKVYYKEKNLGRIVKYCEKDTIAVAQLLMRFNNEKLVEEHEIINV